MAEPISIVTDEISQDLAECERFLRAHRVGAVEVRGVSGKRVPDLEARDLATLRAWATKGEWKILGLSPGLFKTDWRRQASTDVHLSETLPRTIELARSLGASFVITFGFLGEASFPLPSVVIRSLRKAADLCGAAGLPLLLENEPGTLAGTASETAQFLREVEHPNLFVNWDPLNSNEHETKKLEAGARMLLPWIRHVHVKNGRLLPGETHAKCGPLREGAIDWAAHIRFLRGLGYAQYFGVETHYLPRWDGSETVLAELRELLGEGRGAA